MKKYLFLILFISFYLHADFSWDDVGDCDPQFIRVSYSTEDPRTAMGISWNTKGECGTKVLYGKGTDNDLEAQGTSFRANGNLQYVHDVTLKNLKPGTEYSYQVGDENIWSRIWNFTTAPYNTCEPFTFVVASDSRPDTEDSKPLKWSSIAAEAIVEQGAAFMINGGDLVEEGESIQQWMYYLEYTPQIMAAKPVMVAIGNHDDGPGQGDGANFNQLVNYPRNPVTDTEDSYFFRYGNTLFIILSTSTFKEDFEEIAIWMDEVLTKNSDAKWKFVFDHHPFYSSAGVGLNSTVGHEPNEVGQNPIFIPVFDKHHVDMVVSAHSHYYERFSPSYGYEDQDDPDDIAPNPVNTFNEGTVYIVSGGGGAMTYQKALVDIMCGLGSVAGSQKCGGENHYLKFTIDNNILRMETWTTSQQLLGENPSNHRLIDELEIFKADTECINENDFPDEEPVTDDDIEAQDETTDKEIPDDGAEEIADETVDENTSVTDETHEETDSAEKPDNSADNEKVNKSGCSLLLI